MNEFIKELYNSTVKKAWEGKLLEYNILRVFRSENIKDVLLTLVVSAILFSPIGEALVFLDICGAISSFGASIIKEIIKEKEESKEQEYSYKETQEEHKEKAYELQKEDEIVKTIQPTYYKEQEPVESKHKVLVKKLR